MRLVDEAFQLGATPSRVHLDPRLDAREEPAQPLDRHAAQVPGLNPRHDGLRHADPFRELVLRPATAPPERAQDLARDEVVHLEIVTPRPHPAIIRGWTTKITSR